MRLIDKDLCKADIEQFNRPLCDDYHMKDYVLNQIITDIENQPTVDAVPVKHGKWIDMDEQSYTWKVRCSCCDYERSMLSTQGTYPNYCENCGARMDEE